MTVISLLLSFFVNLNPVYASEDLSCQLTPRESCKLWKHYRFCIPKIEVTSDAVTIYREDALRSESLPPIRWENVTYEPQQVKAQGHPLGTQDLEPQESTYLDLHQTEPDTYTGIIHFNGKWSLSIHCETQI